VKVPFTWKVTGWFMIGWSLEFPVGEVRPLRYFGEELVAYRDEAGELPVDAPAAAGAPATIECMCVR
jgi:3-ketosteroid 9alpha-monooxygenase subunit A